jgi:hypothetical protein
MEEINSETALKAAILQLEIKQANERKVLKEQYLLAYEGIKPINLIKSTFKEATASPEFKDEILNTSIGIATGYATKILFQGASHSPVRKLLGTVLMFGITNAVTRHPEAVKSAGKGIFNFILGASLNAARSGSGNKRNALTD